MACNTCFAGSTHNLWNLYKSYHVFAGEPDHSQTSFHSQQTQFSGETHGTYLMAKPFFPIYVVSVSTCISLGYICIKIHIYMYRHLERQTDNQIDVQNDIDDNFAFISKKMIVILYFIQIDTDDHCWHLPFHCQFHPCQSSCLLEYPIWTHPRPPNVYWPHIVQYKSIIGKI